jgi:excisionase family DNA binding protein
MRLALNDELLTSAQAARLLGVTPATVKRWTDAGLIPCARTVGAHRRFRAEDVVRFARSRGASPGDPFETWADRLLEEREPIALHVLLLEERARLGAWWRVAEVLAGAARAIGRRWASGSLGVLDEHAASERLSRAVARVAESLPPREGAPRVLLASAEGDEHTLGLALAEIVLREWGWATRWAGRSVPALDLASALRRREADVLALSATAVSRPATLAAELDAVAPAARAAGGAIVLGGAGPWPEPRAPDARVRDFASLRAFLAAEDARRAIHLFAPEGLS